MSASFRVSVGGQESVRAPEPARSPTPCQIAARDRSQSVRDRGAFRAECLRMGSSLNRTPSCRYRKDYADHEPAPSPLTEARSPARRGINRGAALWPLCRYRDNGHATGHGSRLNRPGVTGAIQFGSSDYSREELIAELTSAFCCAVLGLDNSLQGNVVSYIHGWLTRLRGDPQAVITASTQGTLAADYIRCLAGHRAPTATQGGAAMCPLNS